MVGMYVMNMLFLFLMQRALFSGFTTIITLTKYAIAYYICYVLIKLVYKTTLSTRTKVTSIVEDITGKVKPTSKYIPSIVYFDTLKDLKKDFFNGKTTKANVHTIKVVRSFNTEGAFVIIDNNQLSKNRLNISSGKVSRSNSERRLAQIAGYDKVKGKNVVVNGRKEFLYHRTHLIPFRYCLSEGTDIKNLLFPGTALLNSGSRPDRGYFVPIRGSVPDNNTNRVNNLVRKIDTLEKDFTTNGELPVLDSPETTNGYKLSLDDFERAADKLIKRNPNHVFKYGVFCNYNLGSDIPYSVDAYLIDSTLKKTVFSATLDNKL